MGWDVALLSQEFLSEPLEVTMGWDVSSIRKNLEFTEKTKGEIKQIFPPSRTCLQYYSPTKLLIVYISQH